MKNFSIEQLVDRHRLTLSQIEFLGWGKVDKEALLQEKILALAKLDHIQKALGQLEETGIFFVNLKGIALSQRIYQDPSVRFSKDLDILVPDKKDVLILRKRLLESGWLSADDFWVDEMPRQSWYMNVAMETELVNLSNGIHLEIHWVLDHLIINLKEEGLKELLLTNTQNIHLLGRSVNVLSPELEFIYLLSHGSKHAWFRLKWLVDILHYPKDIIDQDKLNHLLRRFHGVQLIPQADELLKFYFGKGIDFDFKGKADTFLIWHSKEMIASDVSEGSPSFGEFFKYLSYQFLLSGKKRNAFIHLFKNIGIRPQDISEVKLNAYWKYFFYRYYSLLKRKFFSH